MYPISYTPTIQYLLIQVDDLDKALDALSAAVGFDVKVCLISGHILSARRGLQTHVFLLLFYPDPLSLDAFHYCLCIISVYELQLFLRVLSLTPECSLNVPQTWLLSIDYSY